jgi:ADP-ribose pyrophosphatase
MCLGDKQKQGCLVWWLAFIMAVAALAVVAATVFCSLRCLSWGAPDGRLQVGAVVLLGIAVVVCGIMCAGFVGAAMKARDEASGPAEPEPPAQAQADGGSSASGGAPAATGVPAAPADPVGRYLELVAERPWLFKRDGGRGLETDRERIERFARDHGRTMGVVYESAYNIGLVDLVLEDGESPYAYERVIPAGGGSPVLVIPVKRDGGEVRFVLAQQFRHAIRRSQFAFPRGFGENGLGGYQNAKKELLEELGARPVRGLVTLGTLCPDSGLSSMAPEVFLCEVDSFRATHREGVDDVKAVSEDEVWEMAGKDEIDDGPTLAALTLLKARAGGKNLTDSVDILLSKGGGTGGTGGGTATP